MGDGPGVGGAVPGFGGAVPARGPVPRPPDPQPVWTEPQESTAGLTEARTEVAELLGPSPTPVDDLVRRCQFSPAAVMAVLLELELAGRVQTLPGNRVVLLAEQAM